MLKFAYALGGFSLLLCVIGFFCMVVMLGISVVTGTISDYTPMPEIAAGMLCAGGLLYGVSLIIYGLVE